MKIEDFIPKGHARAISREALCRASGLSDREMRRAVNEARERVIILNMSDGNGYFIFDQESAEERNMLIHYVLQETSRISSLNKAIALAREAANE